MKICDIMSDVHTLAVKKGWWDEPRAVPEVLCLLHAEISEALEAFRNRDEALFEEELADIAIRLFDACKKWKVDLEHQIALKHEKNKKRPYRHGGKRA